VNLLKELFKNRKKVNVFETLNSESTITRIVAIHIRNPENPEHFILDNRSKISVALKKWAFEPIEDIGRCGYDYILSFYNDKELIDHSDLCFGCNRLAIQQDIYKISQNEVLKLLKNDFVPVYKHLKKFKSIQEGRIFWKELEGQSEIIFLKKEEPLWLKYDGRFEVNFNVNNPSRENAEKFLQNSFQKISNKEEYKLRFTSQRKSEKEFAYRCYVYGTKKLYDDIEGINKNNWKELQNIEIELMYKHKPE
jgi:hypothetical protein